MPGKSCLFVISKQSNNYGDNLVIYSRLKSICVQADFNHCAKYHEPRRTLLQTVMILLGS